MKTAVITGVSGKIGEAIAKEFLDSGYFVVGSYNNGENQIQELKKQLEAKGQSDYFFAVKSDLSTLDGYKTIINAVRDFKHIDAFIYCAGVSLYAQVEDIKAKELENLMNVNFNSAYLLTGELKDKLSLNEKGKILYISSIWGKVGASLESLYSASKSALIGLTKSLAKELSPNVNVNCLCPGVIDTKMNARFSREEIDELIYKTPKNRLGTPCEIAKISRFICSDDADFITGQIITADGGFTL